MKIVARHLEKDKSGSLTICPEDPEDMWHVYNLLLPGDQLRATTFRRVQNVTSTGSTSSERVRVTLTIRVESSEFDATTCNCRVNGKVIIENDIVTLGSYHTIDLELHRNLSIFKDEWDMVTRERLDVACDISKKAEIAAIVMQEGLANVCLLTENLTIVRQRVEVSITKKRKGSSSQFEKSVTRFHEQIYQALLKHVDFSIVKAILIASPGFYKVHTYKLHHDCV